MCRICGRMFKCVLDSMPSRAPGLRKNRSLLLIPKRTAQSSSSFSTLSVSFSRLSLQSSSPLSRPMLSAIPNITMPTISTSVSQPPPRSFSTSATLGAPRNTYNPSRRVQKRRSGFLARVRTRTGRSLLARRRLKGRKDLSY